VNLLPGVPFAADLAIFVVCAVVIWIAGIRLSTSTDVLSDRLHLGSALGGLILLAVATNLPEIAITVSAAAANRLDVAVSNILGGIAIQTVVLVALDAFGVRARRPLTYQAASLTLVIEGAFVVAVLVAVVMGTQLPKTLVHLRLSPDVVLIAVLWVGGLLLTRRAGRLPGRTTATPRTAARAPRALGEKARRRRQQTGRQHRPGRAHFRRRGGGDAGRRGLPRGKREQGRRPRRAVRGAVRRHRARRRDQPAGAVDRADVDQGGRLPAGVR